ncbi:membrane protein [Streptomyces eurocidicus]|uniref:Membrane protein n=1 Tax=Streptomyces eurocidicus TaxID=66423 RepID=A0A2N8NMJ3_STREU|nr:lipopolysaccharide biosynthesis protein [Streptomyces eurocidicus]MBB5120702.1 O-antigen/teichoic acid export membrane protein [Streptomyces eurocidicus]MBF6050377.1 lipopolysaccharide biosynthesis protein [Streptomyces eurocidicus]PNE29985.1 membrane protein [Streptomyces eurocidicus]
MSDTSTRAQERETAGPAGRRLRLPGRGGGNPLFRNAFALMLNTGISAVLGVGYWLIAARYYSTEAVGQGSAAIAAMKLLAGLAAVTLTGALARFIPIAGRTTGRLVFRTYAGSSLLVALAAGFFLLTLDLWGPSYGFLHGGLRGSVFVLAVVAWSVLTLQDGVLTGLRSAFWVPVGNTVFSAAKLALLVGVASALPMSGVFVSWVVSIAVSVLPLGWLVFRRLVRRHVAATEATARPASAREIGRFLAGDYTGSLFSLAVVYLVPVIVASQVSSTDNAFFYITSTIGGTVNLLAINMGASLTVEGAHDPERLAENCRAALGRMARIMVPVCVLLFVLAPYILGVFGPGYAHAATPLLRWFAVGAALRVVMEVYFAVLRAQSRTAGLAYLQGLLCVLVLGLTVVLLPRMGLTGAGVAEIASLTVIVTIAAVKLRNVLRPTAAAKFAGPAAYAPHVAPDGDLADLADRGDRRDGPSDERREVRRGIARGLGREAGPPAAGQREGAGYGTRWALRAALDADTMPLGVRLDFDHLERRPDLRHTPEAVTLSPAAQPPVSPATSGPVPEENPPERAARPSAAPPAPAQASAVAPPEGEAPPAGEPVAAAAGSEARAPGPVARWRRPETGVWALLAAALALYWVPLASMGPADLDAMGGLGLVSVLPVATLLGAALLVTAFAGALRLGEQRRPLLVAVLLLTVVSLHAVPAVLEDQPRFATAWQHLGFLDFIDRTGVAAPDLDARWSWPGFFALAAFAAKACGVGDLSEVLRWWPTVLQLLCLAPLALLLRAVRAGWRAKWTAAWLFVLCGWVGQDYFSPQALNYFFYLLFVAVLLVWFRWPRQLRGKLLPGEAEVVPAGRRERGALLALLVALFAASVVSHQLTPFVMLGVLTALVLVRRCTLRGLPLLCGVMLAVWVGFLAEPYWSGHFDELFGGLGSLGGNVSSSVSGRIEGGSATHKLVLYIRVALAGGVLACAALGWWRRRRSGTGDTALLVLTAVPFLAFGMQSYGGEVALRVFLFALPGACVLAALALFPRTGRPGVRAMRGPAVALAAGLVLVLGFLVARWGNEPFERVRPGEVAAMDYVYAHDRPTVRLLWMSSDPVKSVTPAVPWGSRDMERVNYRPTLAPRDPARVADLVGELRAAGPGSYLMVNRGQSVYLEFDAGYAPGWDGRLRRALDARPELHRVLTNDDAVLYELNDRPTGDVPEPRPGPAGPRVTWTPVSVAGALAAAALLLLLTARELVRVVAGPGVRQLRWLQSSFWFALPLLVVLLASLVQRFATMS